MRLCGRVRMEAFLSVDLHMLKAEPPSVTRYTPGSQHFVSTLSHKQDLEGAMAPEDGEGSLTAMKVIACTSAKA